MLNEIWIGQLPGWPSHRIIAIRNWIRNQNKRNVFIPVVDRHILCVVRCAVCTVAHNGFSFTRPALGMSYPIHNVYKITLTKK